MDWKTKYAKMLEKNGWTNGNGLGKREEGIKVPIRISKKEDTEGLKSVKERASAFGWWNDSYSLALNSIVISTSDSDFKPQLQKLPEEVKEPKLYGRFVRPNQNVQESPSQDLPNLPQQRKLRKFQLQEGKLSRLEKHENRDFPKKRFREFQMSEVSISKRFKSKRD
eukprot:TRINITY_DN7578_c0_g1_i1.p1 TRINITY_DN7578_c0_g1~~TRINITY_DN7578_c0_g1_i1.p1  ORF type:complete len:167 (+),score=33.37 TRINITY_DN7578_c0_g1_i1:128-628(+)